MPVYTLGNVPDMDKINKIARDFRLPVIADAAASIGAEYKSKKIGELAVSTSSGIGNRETLSTSANALL